MTKKTSAFTLIEVLVASSLTAIVIVGCVYLIASSGRQTNSILELDEIASLQSSYRGCISGNSSIRNMISATNTYDIYFSSSGCILTPSSGGTATGNTIKYTTADDGEQKKQTFYGTFQAFTGSIEGEIKIIQKITGPTVSKQYKYSIFEK